MSLDDVIFVTSADAHPALKVTTALPAAAHALSTLMLGVIFISAWPSANW